ncbi:MAG: dethiobiotin synthase [Betaproteobacteria bacterium RIFCSPLOWO2_02_FULL_67_26]|nr:MAG: dethiobiotin synthase [Betaproteobacteria bacterium RIFCSPLOWO2_02_FULL_67_26]
MHGFFVTGTDTGVGKTLVACSLLRAFAARGVKAVGMKPVASGAVPGADGLVNDDVERLIAASTISVPREHANPYCFAPPIAPHIAAQQAGVTITLDRIERSFRALAALAEVVVVEGAGGFRVPLGADTDSAHMATRLALPVVLVVGLRLGCLNHALLTAESILARGLRLAGWVANHIDPAMAAVEDNVRTLEALITAPLIARIAHSSAPDPAAIAAALGAGNSL